MRTATLEDVDELTALVAVAHMKWLRVTRRSVLPFRHDYIPAVAAGRIELLFRGDEMAAVIELKARDADLVINCLAVTPRLQRRGYGRIMAMLAEERAAQVGFAAVRLVTNVRFEGTLRFFDAMGYRVEREERHSGGARIHMVKHV